MDNPTTLLTAIMFVTILGMGIGNLLMACADIAGGLRKPQPERIHLSWVILLLIALLSLFWETTQLLGVENWTFLDFLYVLMGPMLLFFAASVVAAPGEESAEAHGYYFSICGRFFLMLALQELWLVGIDIRYSNFGAPGMVNLALGLLFIVLAISRNYRLHVIGASIAWAGVVIPMILQGIGLVDS